MSLLRLTRVAEARDMVARIRRHAMLAFSLCQVVASGVASIADAIHYEASGLAVAHVESTTDSDCEAPHPKDCGLCRHLSTHGTPAVFAPLPAQLLTQRLRDRASSRRETPRTAAVLPRGPPALS